MKEVAVLRGIQRGWRRVESVGGIGGVDRRRVVLMRWPMWVRGVAAVG